MTVLVVDDVSIMRIIIKEALMQYCEVDKGDVYEAKSGEEAVIQYKTFKPDIVFLDITMEGMDGLSAIDAIKQHDPYAYIIMCTSSGDKMTVRDCIVAGAKDYIVKPPKPDRVVKAVVDWMKTRPDADENVIRNMEELFAPTEPTKKDNQSD